MKIPLSWLKEYVDVTMDPRELAHRVTLAGVEAEGVTVIGETWDNVFVGLVEAVHPHPNADRLRLATVATGAERETVVCGAPNVAAGQKIAFARVGANLIDGHTGQPSTLKAAKIRGVESKGMVCSEKELGLSADHEGILVLPEDAPIGKAFKEYFGDAIFDFAPTPNRPDCMAVLGVAREVAGVTGQRVREPALDYPEGSESADGKTRVDILDADLCPRYIAGVIAGVKIGPSPRWLQDRLKKAGMRPINNVVDVTNYVMLEMGQPLHAFDYDLLAEGRIIVRRVRQGEGMAFIDGQERRLTQDMLAICDATGPVALAGVMGGSRSEVHDGTRSILLESAAFDRASIRRTSRALALRSEASARFEKGLSPELPLHAARRAMRLILEVAGGTAARGFVDVYPGRVARQRLHLTEARTRQVLGVQVSIAEMGKTLEPLGFQTIDDGPAAASVAVPYWRMDVTIEDDLIEEVARVKGYDWVPMSSHAGELPAYEPQPMLSLKEACRDILAASGMNEVVNYPLSNAEVRKKSFVEGPEPLRTVHPISSELQELRLSLRGSVLRSLAANQRSHEGGVRLFEVGRVYIPRLRDLPDEREVLAGVLSGPRHDPFWLTEPGDLDFFDAKGVLEGLFRELGVAATYAPAQDPLFHPGRTASITVGNAAIGLVGELHPKTLGAFDLLPRPVAYFEVDLEKLLPFLPVRAHMYQPIPRFPGVIRDIALVLDQSVPAQKVHEILAATDLVHHADLFDVYVGDTIPAGKKSLAYRVVFQSASRTLTNDDAQKAQDRLLARLQRELGATLRG